MATCVRRRFLYQHGVDKVEASATFQLHSRVLSYGIFHLDTSDASIATLGVNLYLTTWPIFISRRPQYNSNLPHSEEGRGVFFCRPRPHYVSKV